MCRDIRLGYQCDQCILEVDFVMTVERCKKAIKANENCQVKGRGFKTEKGPWTRCERCQLESEQAQLGDAPKGEENS